MGHSQSDKAETHAKIVKTAAKRLRERGLDGIGVADLMKDAGLTVGGFYKHFHSREDLVAEALASASDTWAAAIARGREEGAADARIFADIVDAYASVEHRDAPGAGCVFGALSADVARSGPKIRRAVTEHFARSLDLLAGLFGDRKSRDARRTAIVSVAALVGAISLARMVSDESLSREILTTVAKALKRLGRLSDDDVHGRS